MRALRGSGALWVTTAPSGAADGAGGGPGPAAPAQAERPRCSRSGIFIGETPGRIPGGSCQTPKPSGELGRSISCVLARRAWPWKMPWHSSSGLEGTWGGCAGSGDPEGGKIWG